MINHQICHHFILLVFLIGPTRQYIIWVKFHLWCPGQVRIFGQQTTQVPNHKVCNFFILERFWPILLLDIQVNIQQWTKLLSCQFQPSDIPYHVLSGRPSEYPTVVSSLFPGILPTVSFCTLQNNIDTNTKKSYHIIFLKKSCWYLMLLKSPIGGEHVTSFCF